MRFPSFSCGFYVKLECMLLIHHAGIMVAAFALIAVTFLPNVRLLAQRGCKQPTLFLNGVRVAALGALILALTSLCTQALLLGLGAGLLLIVGLLVALYRALNERILPDRTSMQENILIVAAHPDDLEIACGATVAKLVDQGHHVHGVIVADGADGGEVGRRKEEAHEGANFLGMESLILLGLPDRDLEHHAKEMIAQIEQALERTQATLVLTHSAHDVHQDHVAVHEAVVRAARHHHSILCFESPSVTAEFKPTVFMDVDDYTAVKNTAIAMHKSQGKKPYMAPELIDASLRVRGRQGRTQRAEGFEVVRYRIAEPGQLARRGVYDEISD